MPETTVRRFRNLYRVTLREKLRETYDGDVNVDFIPKKPRGRPTLLPSELDSRVQVYVRLLRHTGGIINTGTISNHYICNNPCICVNGFRAAGLIACMC